MQQDDQTVFWTRQGHLTNLGRLYKNLVLAPKDNQNVWAARSTSFIINHTDFRGDVTANFKCFKTLLSSSSVKMFAFILFSTTRCNYVVVAKENLLAHKMLSVLHHIASFSYLPYSLFQCLFFIFLQSTNRALFHINPRACSMAS